MSINIAPKFRMTRVLLRMWDKSDRGQPCGPEVMWLVQEDSLREQRRIPTTFPVTHPNDKG